MKWTKRIGIAIIVVFMVACVFIIVKQNAKIKRLEKTALTMSEELSNVQANVNISMIPELSPGKEGWKVTQFGEADREQENCYVITTGTGLVILDGGCEYEVPKLREIIARYGNQVEAWFLSHPHPDHINAFLEIYNEPKGITIDHIYTAEHPSIEKMRERASWDDFSAAERFYNMDIPLEYLHTGDELEVLGGLKVKVLSAYGEEVNNLSKDLMNDGALMLKVSGKRDSMLFCTDVGKSLTNYLVETYGEQLKSDYVQMGHHGNGGPDKAFYQMVNPKGAFFDAPAWIMQNDEKPSTKKKEKLMRKMGAQIYSFYTTPNQIILE